MELYKFLRMPERKSEIRERLYSVLGDNPTLKFTHPLLLNDFNEFKARSSIPNDDRFIWEKRNELLNCFTVSSLSRDWNIPSMWAHYNNHEGICICYDKEKLLGYLDNLRDKKNEYFFGDVNYIDNPPVLDFSKPDIVPQRIDWIKEMTFSKGNCWNYEKEFRIVRFTTSEEKSSVLIKIPRTCISKIIVGIRARDYLAEQIEKHYGFVPIFYEFPSYPTTYESLLTKDKDEARGCRQKLKNLELKEDLKTIGPVQNNNL